MPTPYKSSQGGRRPSRLATLASAALFAGASLIAASAPAVAQSGRGALLTIGMHASPPTLDPARLGAGIHMMWTSSLGYEPLIRFKADGSYEPALAVEWGYVGEGQHQFDIKLRDGVTFADGTPVTAEAVAASLDYAFHLTASTQRWVKAVDGIKVSGPSSVTLTCTVACPELPFLLSQNVQLGSIISPAGLANPDKMATETFGAGPYVVVPAESVSGDHWTYVPNPKYWNQAAIHFDKVVLRAIPDPNARIASLLSGQVDLINEVAPKAVAQLEAGGALVSVAQTAFTGLIFLDRTGKISAPLADVRVRQALNHAIDRKAITDALGFGHAFPTMQPTGVGSGVYDEALETRYPYDPEKAKALLAEAGYPDGFTLKVETQLPQGDISDYTLAVLSMWEEIGVKSELTSDQTITAWLDSIKTQTFPVASYGYGTLPYSLQTISFFTNTGGPFNAYVPDDHATELMAKAADASPEEANAILRELNAYAVEQAFAAPLAQRDSLFASNPTINFVPHSSLNGGPLITEITPR